MIELRPVRLEDAGFLYPLIYRTPVTDTILWDGPESFEAYQAALLTRIERAARGEIGYFSIVELASDQPVGMLSLRPEEGDFRADIGLWIGEPYQDKGYGSRAVRQILAYGFDQLRLEKIEASVFVGNWASRRIFEKNGFQLEGMIRKAVRKRGHLLDNWLLGITREDYGRARLAWQAPEVSGWVVHLCPRTDWQTAVREGQYRAASLDLEGFIHASRPEQILAVANRFYPGLPDLVLLWIDPGRLTTELRWETVGEEVFPHIYGPISIDAVVATTRFLPDPDRTFRVLPAP